MITHFADTTPFFTIVFGFVAMLFLVPAILQRLWNMTMPDVFKLPNLTYWQSFRLLIICAMLFGSGVASN